MSVPGATLTLPATIVAASESYAGGGGSDTLVGGPGNHSWTVTAPAAGMYGGAPFTSFESLEGGSGSDSFTVSGGSALSIDGGGGSDGISIPGTFAASPAATLAAERIETSGSGRVIGQALTLSGAASIQLATAISTLDVRSGTGPVAIRETDGLTIARVMTTGAVTVVAGGSIAVPAAATVAGNALTLDGASLGVGSGAALSGSPIALYTPTVAAASLAADASIGGSAPAAARIVYSTPYPSGTASAPYTLFVAEAAPPPTATTTTPTATTATTTSETPPVETPAPAPKASLKVSGGSFDPTTVRPRHQTTLTIVIDNVGGAASAATTLTAAGQTPPVPAVAAGGRVTVRVTFTPTSAGSFNVPVSVAAATHTFEAKVDCAAPGSLLWGEPCLALERAPTLTLGRIAVGLHRSSLRLRANNQVTYRVTLRDAHGKRVGALERRVLRAGWITLRVKTTRRATVARVVLVDPAGRRSTKTLRLLQK
jgi:hypothetical protein